MKDKQSRSTIFYIKGRFLGQKTTGQQRYAREIVDALDALLDDPELFPGARFVVVAPPSVTNFPHWRHIEARNAGRLSGHAWEQLELPFIAADGVLITLCGTPCIGKRRQITVLFDAGVFDIPFSYDRKFVAWNVLAYKLAARRKQTLVTISEFSRSRLSSVLDVSSENIHLVSCGSDHMFRIREDEGIFAKYPSLLTGPYVLTVGSSTPHKNFAIVAEAAQQFAGSGVRFVVAGQPFGKIFRKGGKPAGELLSIGYPSDGELKALYRRAACYVFPSLYEGFGLPAVEAMSAGCPVIASNRPSLPEICGEAAVLFDPDSAHDLVNSLNLVLGSPTMQEKLRLAGRHRAAEYTWERSARSFVEVITAELETVR